MNIELLRVAVFQLGLVFTPAIAFGGFGWIRWDLRSNGTGSTLIIRSLTFIMWGLVVLGAAGVVLGLPLIAGALDWLCLVAFFWHTRIGELLGRAPDPRVRTVEAVRHVFELASSPFKPVDVDELRLELAALDEYVTPQTFEYIQLTRALMLHWLDGGSPTAANATRWRKRMNDIAIEWFPWNGPKAARDPRRLLRRVVTRWWLPLTVIGSVVLGASVWGRGWPSPLEVTAGIVVGYLLMWTDQLLVAATGLVSFVVGLAASTVLQILECPSCGWTSTIATVAAISIVGLLCAWFLIFRHRKPEPTPPLTVIGAPVRPDEAEDPQP
jgi:hypothetical protein